jgi:hypothetical protein
MASRVEDQRLHTQRALHGVRDVLVRIFVEPAAITLPEQLGICGHHAEWLLEIV